MQILRTDSRPTESEWGGGVGQPFVLRNLPGDSNVPKV